MVISAVALALTLSWRAADGQLRYERAFSDLWHNLAGVRAPATKVALVVVDRATLDAHPDEPLITWGPYFAQVISVLEDAGATVIAVDFQFNVTLEDWLSRLGVDGGDVSRTWDAPLRQALSRGKTILAGGFEGSSSGPGSMVLPTAELLYSLPRQTADIGFANLVPDPDGVLRHFIPTIGDGDDRYPTFGGLAALRAGADPDFVGRTSLVRLPWIGPPGTIPSLSFQALLEPDASSNPEVQALKGRVVIIAAEARSLHDTHLTPYSRALLGTESRQMMIGAEIQANVVEALLRGRTLKETPLTGVLLAVLLVTLGMLAAARLRPSWAILVNVGLMLLVVVLSYAAFQADYLLEVGPTHLGMVFGAVGMLAARLTGEERRRRGLIELFGRYVSDDVVEMLVASGRTPDLGGEVAEVTVMFMDIRNFTGISEKLSATEIIGMLNNFFADAVGPVLDQGGTVDKFLGDGLMAVFGSPVPYPDHARRALRAALEMERVARAFDEWPDFAIGIGIHTGIAVTGNVGSEKRMQYTAIGDTVNTAARLEAVTKQMGVRIAISDKVVDAAGPGLVLGKFEAVKVKGRVEAVQVYELLGLEDTTP
ncbi:MAG: adenylate cyclase [Myxococcota bacterium]